MRRTSLFVARYYGPRASVAISHPRSAAGCYGSVAKAVQILDLLRRCAKSLHWRFGTSWRSYIGATMSTTKGIEYPVIVGQTTHPVRNAKTFLRGKNNETYKRGPKI